MDQCCTVVDLRQYALHHGRRDTLIEVFDEHFVEGQEEAGMHIVGQFRDLDDADAFVWIRGFRSLRARADALSAFYYGPIWREYGPKANETMLDSDNALLLKPVHLGAGYPSLRTPRPSRGTTGLPGSIVAGAVYHRPSPDDGFVRFFTDNVLPELTASGATPVAVFETLVAENNFPALPLRDEFVLAWFARFDGQAAYDEHRERLATSAAWQGNVLPELLCRSVQATQELRLRPTARSQLR
jgi:hypothetical protein